MQPLWITHTAQALQHCQPLADSCGAGGGQVSAQPTLRPVLDGKTGESHQLMANVAPLGKKQPAKQTRLCSVKRRRRKKKQNLKNALKCSQHMSYPVRIPNKNEKTSYLGSSPRNSL